MAEKLNTPLNLPSPPYFAVIFSSEKSVPQPEGYAAMAERMLVLARCQPGFLGYESAGEQLAITVSYWDSLESIHRWKQQEDHLLAQQKGRTNWYTSYSVRICKVEKAYTFVK